VSLLKFYIGFSWDKKIRDNNTYPYCFISIASNYSYNCYKKLTPWFINNAKDIMLDSGGFSFLNRFGDYPFGFDKFVEWIHMIDDVNDCGVGYVATPDYPCEKDITRTCKLKSNRERIIKTVDNAIIIMDEYPDINWMPVLQGFTLDEYKHCLDLYRNRGINPEKFAIGSMCRRKNVRQIENYVRNLIEYGLTEKIHLFGLLMNGLKSKYLFDTVDSCDSISFSYNVYSQKEKIMKRDKTLEVVGGLLLKNKEQITLMDYIDYEKSCSYR